MKSKLALMLIAAVGSSVLVAAAQTPYPPTQYGNVSSQPPPDSSRSLFAPVATLPPSVPPQPPVLAPSPPGPNAPYVLPMFHSGPGWGGRVTSAEEANLAREADQ